MQRFFLFSALCLCVLPSSVSAASDGIFLSEVAWAGSSLSNADEWIEIVNLTGEDVSLAGWTLAGAGTGGGDLVFPEGASVSASSTFVIANYGATHENSSLLSEPDWATTAVSLSNSALGLILRDASGEEIDRAGDGGAPPAGSSGEVRVSMVRISPVTDGSTAAAWTASDISSGFKAGIADLGTPGTFSFEVAETDGGEDTEDDVPGADDVTDEEPPRLAIPDPIVTAIRISEVYPAPFTGEEEWIEFVNISSVGEFLDGWTIEDEKGAATLLEGLVLPWGRIVITAPKGALNNGGDIVILKDPKGRVIDGMAYGTSTLAGFSHAPSPKRGESLIRPELQERFVVTDVPTPGAPNIERAPEPETPPAPTKPKTAAAPVVSGVEPPVAPPPTMPVTPPAGRGAAPVAVPRESLPVAPTVTLTQSPKAVTATSAAPKKASRYKGSSFTATIAVPPGAYGKTRMRVIIGDRLRELWLTKSSVAEYRAGEQIRFVAQEKEEAGQQYLLANVNSLSRADEGAPFEFLETSVWPSSVGAFRLKGEVKSVDGKSVRLVVAGEEGVIHAPKSLNGRGIGSGDRVEVLGFFSPGVFPELIMPDDSSLTSLESAPLAPEAESSWTRWVGIALLACMVVAGASFHLMQGRNRARLLETPLD